LQRPRTSEARLDVMIEASTVDCYNEADQVTGLFTNFEEYLTVPFETTALDVHVTVVNVDLTDHDQIAAICNRDDLLQAIPSSSCPCRHRRPMARNGSRHIDAGSVERPHNRSMIDPAGAAQR
jgi:hypothetical protein